MSGRRAYPQPPSSAPGQYGKFAIFLVVCSSHAMSLVESYDGDLIDPYHARAKECFDNKLRLCNI